MNPETMGKAPGTLLYKLVLYFRMLFCFRTKQEELKETKPVTPKTTPKDTKGKFKKAKLSAKEEEKKPKVENKSPIKLSPKQLKNERTEEKPFSTSPSSKENKSPMKLMFGSAVKETDGKKPNDYNPAIGKYHPIKDAIWSYNEKYNLN